MNPPPSPRPGGAILLLLGLTALAAAAGEGPTVAGSNESVLTREAPVASDEIVPMHPLRFGSVSFYSENDKYFAGTDQRYTNGFKLSALSTDLRSFRDREVPGLVRSIARSLDRLLDPRAQPRLGFSIGQNLYTPSDTQATEYIPEDRPYAAWLYFGTAFHNYVPSGSSLEGAELHARLDVFEINLGVVGPWALGRQVQNNFHKLIGVETAKGWDNQIHNEPGLNLIYERKWRYSTSEARTGWGVDAIPRAGVCVGNVNTHASLGGEVRAGYRLPADFGASLIRPSGDSNAVRRPDFNVFVFAMTEGRAVLRDITLDGNTWRDSPSIDKKPFVMDVSAGLGIGTRHFQLTYAQAWRSEEFEGQADWQEFGSVAVSWFF